MAPDFPTPGVPVPLANGEEGRLRYTVRALWRLEQEAGEPPLRVVERLEGLSVRALALLLWAGLLWDRPRLTVDEVVDGLLALDRLEAVSGAIAEAFALAVGGGNRARTSAAEDAPPASTETAGGAAPFAGGG